MFPVRDSARKGRRIKRVSSRVSKITVSRLKHVADDVFSLHIRIRDRGICFTCGKKGDTKAMQCGHFVSRVYNALRYDPINAHCQCPRCNLWLHGNMVEYAERMVERYGTGILAELNRKKREVKQFNVAELQSIITTYGEKVKGYNNG